MRARSRNGVRERSSEAKTKRSTLGSMATHSMLSFGTRTQAPGKFSNQTPSLLMAFGQQQSPSKVFAGGRRRVAHLTRSSNATSLGERVLPELTHRSRQNRDIHSLSPNLLSNLKHCCKPLSASRVHCRKTHGGGGSNPPTISLVRFKFKPPPFSETPT